VRVEIALVTGTLLLAGVFATAGLAKLADLPGSRDAVAAFGIPPRLAPWIGAALPGVELLAAALLAAGLVAGGLAQAGASIALALVALFCIAIVANLARGRAPDCHCFGQLHSAPAGPRTLARNGVLLVLAAFVLSDGDTEWTAAGTAGAGTAIAAGAVLRRRREGPFEPADDGDPAIGGLAPDFRLPSLEGLTVSLGDLLGRGRQVLLVFTDPDCGPCIALAPEVAAWQRAYDERLTIVVVERAGGRNGSVPDEHGRRNVLLQRDDAVSTSYHARGTPSAVLVESDGRIASRVASGGPAIRSLLARAIPGAEPEPAVDGRSSFWAPVDRRELLARAAAASATLAALAAPSAWASHGQLERRCRHERCGDRCCPKRAKCRRRRNGRKVCVCPGGRRPCRNRCCPKKAKCRKRGKRRICICRDGRKACGSRCCRETYVCRRVGPRRRRRCACPVGFTECGGRCVRTRTDPNHCGRCGRTCPTGTSCVDGECVEGDGTGTGPGGSGACDCPPGKACCEGQCTDLNESEEHCGDCGKTCAAGKTCCDGHCLELQSDPQNCGRCGRRCADNEVCSEGECRRRCARGLKNCRGSCVDTSSNHSNCGGCGISCTGPFDTGECCNGKCCDINGSTCCPGGCKNLALDDDNCGACGHRCPPGSFCRFGTCSQPV
jgi:uncharacterized membrane protein YphA (DoxX/SURF4 family)/thiol-disulfide isomerase/thioredoxin